MMKNHLKHETKPRRIILFGTWAEENLGDDLMLRVQIDRIREAHPDAVLIVPTGNREITRSMLEAEGVSTENIRLLYTGRWGLREPGKPFFASLRWMFSELSELFRADLLRIGPGNQIQDVTRKYRVLFFLFRGFLAWLFRTPFAIFGMGFFSLTSSFSRKVLRFLGNRAAFVSTRDDGGAVEFRNLGISPDRVHSLADVSFAFNWPPVPDSPANEVPVIGLSSRILLKELFDETVVGNYEACYASLLQHIRNETGARFQFFMYYRGSQWHDGVARDRLLAHIDDPDFPMETIPFQNLFATRDGMTACDAFIGVRYHSILISVQNNIPVLPISYGNKTTRFIREQGLERYFVEVPEVTDEKLQDRWARVWENRDQWPQIAADIREQAEPLAKQHFQLINQVLEKRR